MLHTYRNLSFSLTEQSHLLGSALRLRPLTPTFATGCNQITGIVHSETEKPCSTCPNSSGQIWLNEFFLLQLPPGPHGHPVPVTAGCRVHYRLASSLFPSADASRPVAHPVYIFPWRVLPSTEQDSVFLQRSATTCWRFPSSGWTASMDTFSYSFTTMMTWCMVQQRLCHLLQPCSGEKRLISFPQFGHPRMEGHLDP